MEEETFLGRKKEEVILYSGLMEQGGTLIFYDKGFHIKYNDESIKAPYSYITEIEKMSDAGLGTVKIRLVAFDMFGNKYDLRLVMPDDSYAKLKKLRELSE